MGLFGRKRGSQRDAESREMSAGLRGMALDLRPEQLGESAVGAPVLALLMETGYPGAVATLSGVVDGSTSLYFSSGGGMIGAGEHETVRTATRAWLALGAEVLADLPAVREPPLPEEGWTQFVAVTPDGLRGVVVREAELGGGGHPLSPLFQAGHDVITQIRLLDEANR